jgi:hypothetical protein
MSNVEIYASFYVNAKDLLSKTLDNCTKTGQFDVRGDRSYQHLTGAGIRLLKLVVSFLRLSGGL